MGPSVIRRSVHRLDSAIPSHDKYIGKVLRINQVDFKASRELSNKNLPSSIIAQIELSVREKKVSTLERFCQLRHHQNN